DLDRRTTIERNQLGAHNRSLEYDSAEAVSAQKFTLLDQAGRLQHRTLSISARSTDDPVRMRLRASFARKALLSHWQGLSPGVAVQADRTGEASASLDFSRGRCSTEITS